MRGCVVVCSRGAPKAAPAPTTSARGAAPKASTSPASSRRRAPEPEPAAPSNVRHRGMEGGVEVVFYSGPLPPLADEPLSPAELAFRDLIAGEVTADPYGGDRVEVRPEHHEWSERVRLAWERRNVIWLHGYADGKPVWRRERPRAEVEPAPKAAASGKASALERFKLDKTQERRD